MQRLTNKDLLALLEFIEECYSVCDLDTFAQRVISKLPKIVPSDITSYNEVNPRKERGVRFLVYPQNAYTPGENQVF